MTTEPESVEIWQDTDSGWMRCAYGTISLSNVWPDDPGMMHDMGQLILVTVPFERDTKQLAELGIDFTVTDGIARTVARNGSWAHRVQPAHWREGRVPNGWSPEIMLGIAVH